MKFKVHTATMTADEFAVHLAKKKEVLYYVH